MEQRNGLLDAPPPRLGGLRAVDVVDVVALQAVRQPREEGGGLGVARQGLGKVRRHIDLARAVGKAQRDTDRVVALEAGGLADRGADADHVLAAITATVLRYW